MNINDLNNQTENLETQKTMNRIYTIGHSNYKIEYFIQLLKKNSISLLNQQTKSLFENAGVNIITIGVQPPEASSLLESYVIFYGSQKGEKPILNVDY